MFRLIHKCIWMYQEKGCVDAYREQRSLNNLSQLLDLFLASTSVWHLASPQLASWSLRRQSWEVVVFGSDTWCAPRYVATTSSEPQNERKELTRPSYLLRYLLPNSIAKINHKICLMLITYLSCSSAPYTTNPGPEMKIELVENIWAPRRYMKEHTLKFPKQSRVSWMC